MLFPLNIEKLLGKDLPSTEIKKCLLEYETVNITYNNCNVIVSIIANSKSKESEREKESVIVKRKGKVMWMFKLTEVQLPFCF